MIDRATLTLPHRTIVAARRAIAGACGGIAGACRAIVRACGGIAGECRVLVRACRAIVRACRGIVRARRVMLTAVLAVLVLAAAPGCRRDTRIVDERLLLALEEARAWQHRADTHLADHDVAGAIADVQQVLAIDFPKGAPEGEEARLDAWARLARLHLGPAAADEERALADVARGEAEASRDSFYRAHLETVAGEILEARANRLAPADADGAKAARKEALAAYARSIEINKRVQAALLKETP